MLKSWRTMVAVMKGPKPNITMERFWSVPPVKTLKRPKTWNCSKKAFNLSESTPGMGMLAIILKTTKTPKTSNSLLLRLLILKILIMFLIIEHETWNLKLETTEKHIMRF